MNRGRYLLYIEELVLAKANISQGLQDTVDKRSSRDKTEKRNYNPTLENCTYQVQDFAQP